MMPKLMKAVAVVVAVFSVAVLSVQSLNAQTFKTLDDFSGGTDGGYPSSGVVEDDNGNLYGTTSYGGDLNCLNGPQGCGVVFKLSKAGKESVLYSFTGGADGGYPSGGLIQDPNGNLYGTSQRGAYGWGTVFKLSQAGEETVLYAFDGGSDGGAAYSGVVRDTAGNLYGATFAGGDLSCPYHDGCGVVFKLSRGGKLTVLHSFTGGSDGLGPSGLFRDAKGNLYGTTVAGGRPGCGTGCGVVFRLSQGGKLTVLYSFTGGGDGENPTGGVIQDAKGNLYGTTFSGGAYGFGTVFKLTKLGRKTLLHSFTGGADGGYPDAGVIRDRRGNLYGTAQNGGDLSCDPAGCGVVFMLNEAGEETILHTFTGEDGAYPTAGVTQDSSRTLYGTTARDGVYGYGTVFKVTH